VCVFASVLFASNRHSTNFIKRTTLHPTSPPLTRQGPYGAPCIRELLRFLIAMVNRRDRINTDSVVTVGLGLLTTALETAGPALGRFPSVMEVCVCICMYVCMSVCLSVCLYVCLTDSL
jgi:hypothetical protein